MCAVYSLHLCKWKRYGEILIFKYCLLLVTAECCWKTALNAMLSFNYLFLSPFCSECKFTDSHSYKIYIFIGLMRTVTVINANVASCYSQHNMLNVSYIRCCFVSAAGWMLQKMMAKFNEYWSSEVRMIRTKHCNVFRYMLQDCIFAVHSLVMPSSTWCSFVSDLNCMYIKILSSEISII